MNTGYQSNPNRNTHYHYLPVEGCEDCEYNVALDGDNASACPDCTIYGDAEKVVEEGGAS
jgi:hypothetical protein